MCLHIHCFAFGKYKGFLEMIPLHGSSISKMINEVQLADTVFAQIF